MDPDHFQHFHRSFALPMMVGIPKEWWDDHSPQCLDHGIIITLDIVHDTGNYSETRWDSLGLNGARLRLGGASWDSQLRGAMTRDVASTTGQSQDGECGRKWPPVKRMEPRWITRG